LDDTNLTFGDCTALDRGQIKRLPIAREKKEGSTNPYKQFSTLLNVLSETETGLPYTRAVIGVAFITDSEKLFFLDSKPVRKGNSQLADRKGRTSSPVGNGGREMDNVFQQRSAS
jgi:hypothetical protein